VKSGYNLEPKSKDPFNGVLGHEFFALGPTLPVVAFVKHTTIL
jgi:hypothetical protein